MAVLTRDYLGKGFDFPFKFNLAGGVSTASYERKIKLNIANVLSTPQGTRFMEESYGSNLHTFLYEPLDSITIRLITKSIKDTLNYWIPLINVNDVSFDNPGGVENYLPIKIKYTIKSTNTEDNLVYPYYRP